MSLADRLQPFRTVCSESECGTHSWSEEIKVGEVRARGLVFDKMERECDYCNELAHTYAKARCGSCEGHKISFQRVGYAMSSPEFIEAFGEVGGEL